ncbi:hypothetical protein NEOLEDRAFT_1130643 [Neolentinus lepideus HHB14362 ss-1]|uniref:Uncharacterized protein n=1 Tax=Neolentinus lepideus HHB14362 ss-1 TaxID=1314782 RepID=A0A165U481_9AGAM|nr:hypothetical protein NEOLEDRAFT_1130643 [Neolentinus lepideus HHB14362 ss-1]
MSPRPILKRDPPSTIPSNPLPFATCPTLFSPKVHFPPTPTMTSTHPTHSPFTYDRAPIIVSPNACALPERGGREVYSGERQDRSVERPRGRSRDRKAVSIKGSYFHPRAYEACEAELPAGHTGVVDADCDVESMTPLPATIPLPPPLVHDISSSESDESDVTTPPDIHSEASPSLSFASACKSQYPNSHYHPSLNTAFASQAEMNSALAFLPYPPSPVRERTLKLMEDQRKWNPTPSPKQRKPPIKRANSAFAEPPLDGCLGGF